MKSPEEHLTKSLAYHQLGGFLGGALNTAFVAYLASFLGWRSTLQIIPMIGLPFVIIFWFAVKEEEKAPEEKLKEEMKREQVGSLLTRPILVVLLASLISTLGWGSRIFLPAFLSKAYGESVATAGILSGLTQVVGCVSLVMGGVLADRFDKISIASFSFVMTGFFTILISTTNLSFFLLLPVLALLGFGQYFGGPAMHALTQAVSPEEVRGRISGFEFSLIALGRMGTSLMVGYLTDLVSINFAFIITSLFQFIAFAFLFVFRRDLTHIK
jgi:predicted MFS family arabinose efflux permease